MTKFEIKEIQQAFETLEIQKGDHLFVHSSLRAFGVPQGYSIRELPRLFFESLQDIIGDQGSISVPTFNFSFAKGNFLYNRQETPSKGMGAFSEYVRKLPLSLRSTHPMQSISVYGQKKEYIIGKDTLTAFEKESAFDRLLEFNAKVLLLGATFETVSFIHTADHIFRPPYRFYKEFSGEYADNGVATKKTYAMLVRDLEMDPKIDKFHIEHVLGHLRKIKKTHIGAGKVQLFLAQDFVDIALDCMNSNPYFFVENDKRFEIYYK